MLEELPLLLPATTLPLKAQAGWFIGFLPWHPLRAYTQDSQPRVIAYNTLSNLRKIVEICWLYISHISQSGFHPSLILNGTEFHPSLGCIRMINILFSWCCHLLLLPYNNDIVIKTWSKNNTNSFQLLLILCNLSFWIALMSWQMIINDFAHGKCESNHVHTALWTMQTMLRWRQSVYII